jgi:NAD(P)-dependent dehydrogenase (short-subunit alcohol dehydrogenase family)
MELEGQVAIVTGAGRGIGRATALELARMGADIVVAELNRENAERTASEVRGLGRRADGTDGRHVPPGSRDYGRANTR